MSASDHFTRRGVLAGLAAAMAAPALAEPPTRSLRPMPRPGAVRLAAPAVVRAPQVQVAGADALIAAARLGGRVGFAVRDGNTGALLEGFDADLPLPPASVAKTVTALYALDRLGAGYRFATRLLATGPVAGGRVQGDLVLTGSGDPTLTSDTLGDLAAALRARGVRGITGRFLVHGGALPHIAAIAADQPDHVGYNPAVSGLNLNFNRVHFEWKRAQKGWQVSMDARADRFVPQVQMARMRVVDRQAPLFTYAQEGRRESWTVAAAALGKGGSRWLPVRQPELYAAEVFQTLARAQGIDLPEPRTAAGAVQGTVLAEAASAPLQVILRDMLRHSTNLTAEVVGLAASGAGGLADSGARMSAWLRARHGVAPRFVDHSGLGAASRISAADLSLVLAQVGAGGPLRPILRDFALRDDRGRPMKAGPVTVAAKTGTLNFVSGLGGYATMPSGRVLSFAIFAADVARRDRLSAAERERPAGGAEWTQRARVLQSRLIERWAAVYG
ncbi:D-alanyl-D-alanine carboxypeptidase/D-alanyl-D-alanine endopeptidase [Ruixingdingia sedimenti]|uniref:D-alanyl-D-alanine carboxypeptidase/D-alanyl-D-alanine-endopeptidase n=1 Tax=Ruixingdingia sedimenti TaxID=3073604 RepID=A0ABU1FFU0_9RHOB|nr:D-alanyl-D-alanine carboxypeptidase/D-alanyl-D-alanine-endopeptidase [Xinfangfangia sp. LG-4]MDR5655262.1 D-alanyl-D-alanine carboxypeptidase/D-alanyl-D-alanine-endopeptidase [Xinfangfangia sp. LG-4]